MPLSVTLDPMGLDSTAHGAAPGTRDLSLKLRLRRLHMTNAVSFRMAESTIDIPTSYTDFLADFAGQFHVLAVEATTDAIENS